MGLQRLGHDLVTEQKSPWDQNLQVAFKFFPDRPPASFIYIIHIYIYNDIYYIYMYEIYIYIYIYIYIVYVMTF